MAEEARDVSNNKSIKISNPLWKDIHYQGHHTDYEVSNSGIIRNRITNKILFGSFDKNGYIVVSIRIGKDQYVVKLHRLVATAFIPNPDNKPTVNHKNGNKSNCNDWNLEWATYKENNDHALNTGLRERSKPGMKSPHRIYSQEIIRSVCKLLAEGKSPSLISSILGIHKTLPNNIKYKGAWADISKDFNIPGYKKIDNIKESIKLAKKKVPSIEDAIELFKETMIRVSLASYYQVNNILLSINNDQNKILIIPDPELWEEMWSNRGVEDIEEFKKSDPLFRVKELDITVPEEYEFQQWFQYGENLVDNWIPIDLKEDLFTGKIFKINIKGYEYDIPINRELMPIKLKKSEFENISYRVFLKPLPILSIKKRFDFPIEGCGFTLMRLFQII